MRFIGTLVLVLGLLLPLSLAAAPAEAQDTTPYNSTTLTEAFLNTKLLEHRQPDAKIFDITIDLQPGQIVLGGQIDSDLQTLELTLTLVPSVTNRRLALEATELTIGQRTVNLAADQYGAGDTASTLRDLIADTVAGNQLETVTVTDTELTLQWQRSDPDAPALAFLDNTLTMTATESYFNTLSEMTNPSNPEFDSFTMDFQPGQAVLTTTYTGSDGVPYAVKITYVPTVVEGLATWDVQTMVVGSNNFDSLAIGQINDDIVRSWRMLFSGFYRTAKLTNIELTEDTISLTWDSGLDLPIAFDPDAGAVIVSEGMINGALNVTSPATYTISNVSVDLQPGQAVLSARLTLPSGRVYSEQIIFLPTLDNGVLEWTVGSASLDGTAVDDITIARFNETMTKAWTTTVWRNMSAYRVTSITVNDTEISMTIRPR